MKLGLGIKFADFGDDILHYAAQLGVTHVVLHSPSFGERGFHEAPAMAETRSKIESFGLKWEAIENLPGDQWDDILRAGDRREQQMDGVCRTIENMGKVGVPILGYYFSISSVEGHWRTYDQGGGRGGCHIKSFDIDRMPERPDYPDAPVSVDEMWERLQWFLERAVPVAEAAGVKLAAHQDDPPIEMLRGTGRLLTSHDAMQRLIDLVPSPSNGLEFCQGTVAEMGTDTAVDAVRRFAGQGKIFYVHFRNVIGQFPRFDEVFIDEGDVDMFEAMTAYRDAGYDGVLIPDHCPVMHGTEGYRYRGMAFSLGYMRALLQVVDGVRAYQPRGEQ